MPTGRAVPKWGGWDKEQKGVSLEVSSFLKTPPLGPVEGHSALLHVEDTLGGGEGQRKAMAGSRPLFSALGRGVFPILSPICRRKKRRFFFPLLHPAQTAAHCIWVWHRTIVLAHFEVV